MIHLKYQNRIGWNLRLKVKEKNLNLGPDYRKKSYTYNKGIIISYSFFFMLNTVLASKLFYHYFRKFLIKIWLNISTICDVIGEALLQSKLTTLLKLSTLNMSCFSIIWLIRYLWLNMRKSCELHYRESTM